MIACEQYVLGCLVGLFLFALTKRKRVNPQRVAKPKALQVNKLRVEAANVVP